MKFVNLLDYAEMIYTCVGFVIGFLVNFMLKVLKEGKIKKVILSNRGKKECFVSIPTFRTQFLDIERNIIIEDEVIQFTCINNFLKEHRIIVLSTGSENVYDAIHIGGPAVNRYVNRYFSMYIKNVEWKVRSDRYERYSKYNKANIFNYDFINITEEGKEGILVENDFYEFIPYKKNWAMIIKLFDNESGGKRVVHLLFGSSVSGTMGAVQYFIECYPEIYRRHKSKEYVGIFEVDNDGTKIGKMKWYVVSKIFK